MLAGTFLALSISVAITANRSYKKKKKGEATNTGKAFVSHAGYDKLPEELASTAHAEAMANGADCTRCSLYGLRLGPVPDVIKPNARLTIITDNPKPNDVIMKRPFVGYAAQRVEELLLRQDVSFAESSIIHAQACRTPEDMKSFELKQRVAYNIACVEAEEAGRPPPAPPVMPAECCAPRLRKAIAASNASTLLALNERSLMSVARVWDVAYGTSKKVRAGVTRIASMIKQLGSPLVLPARAEHGLPKTTLVASYPPSFAMSKGQYHWMQAIEQWIERAAKIAKNSGEFDWHEPEFILNPTVEQVQDILGKFAAAKVRCSIDIETDRGTRKDGRFDPRTCRIRCIGFGAVLDGEEVIICVPLRCMGGREWWGSWEEKKLVLEAIIDCLANVELLGQNFSFDSGVMLRCRLMLSREQTYLDTMLAHRNTPDCDLPHDLGFVTSRKLEAPAWKSMADDKLVEDADDAVLHLYNCRDVLVVLRLWPLLEDDLYKYGSTLQYLDDQELAPIVRDMGDLGVFIDEKERANLSVTLGAEVIKRRTNLKEIVGNPDFNPNSGPQVQRYLFKTKGLLPTVNGKGKDLKEGEDPSTCTQALLKMVHQAGADDEAKAFINNLLEYRAYTKLKSTYVDNLPVWFPDWNKEGELVEVLPPVTDQILVKLKKKERVERVAAGQPDVEMEWREQVIFDERMAVSRLSLAYKQHVVSSARLAVSPNIQAFPDRGKANTRRMVIAPPRHVIAGADFDQIELRIYAANAQDKILLKAFHEGMDPHAYNAASMFCKKRKESIDQTYTWIIGLPKEHGAKALVKAGAPQSEQVLELLAATFKAADEERIPDAKIAEWAAERLGLQVALTKAFQAGWKKGEKEKKTLRGYAKTFCIAEGERVLTDKGLVPIEQITTGHRVWDGIEWVSHDGVIFQGEKNVIEYDGLRATADHKVWTTDGRKMRLDEAARWGACLARTGAGRDPIRFMDDSQPSVEKRELQIRVSTLYGTSRVLCRKRSPVRQPQIWKIFGLSKLQSSQSRLTGLAQIPSELHATALHKPEQPKLFTLRQSRYRIPIWFRTGRRNLDCRPFGAAPEFGTRPHRQRWPLRAWKLTLRDRTAAGFQPNEHDISRGFYLSRGGVAVYGTDGAEALCRRVDARRDDSASRRDGGRTRHEVAYHQGKVRTYDILNAGPRRRFTVEGVLVSNCYLIIYGGAADKLGSFMISARDKATGDLCFPGLRQSDVDEWFDGWHQTHPETLKWQSTAERMAKVEGFTAARLGSFRKRWFPGGANKPGATYNHQNQSTAAEIANRATKGIAKRIPYKGWSKYTGICIQAHDYIGVYCPTERGEEAAAILKEEMTTVFMGIPITANPKISKSWADQ